MPNSTGGISIATNQLANEALLNLNRNQGTLGKLVSQLSSGLRVVTAADDPSGHGHRGQPERPSRRFRHGEPERSRRNERGKRRRRCALDGDQHSATCPFARHRSSEHHHVAYRPYRAARRSHAVDPRNQPDFFQHELQRPAASGRQPRGLPTGGQCHRNDYRQRANRYVQHEHRRWRIVLARYERFDQLDEHADRRRHDRNPSCADQRDRTRPRREFLHVGHLVVLAALRRSSP